MTTQTPAFMSFQTWKELYDRFEKTWTGPMHELIGTESFAASMAATRDGYLTSQKAQREAMEQYLESLHMPSKSDLSRLAGQVVALESKLENLEDRFDTLEARFDSLDGRIGGVEAKLDAVLSALAKLPATSVVEAVVPPADEAPVAAKRRAK